MPDDDRVELSWVAVALSMLATGHEQRDAFALVLESSHRRNAPGVVRFDRLAERPPYALLPAAVAGCARVLAGADVDAMVAGVPRVSRSMSALGGVGDARVRWVVTTVLDVVAEAAARHAALASWQTGDDG